MKTKGEILDETYNPNLGFLSITYEQVLKAMDTYASQQTEGLRKENERLREALGDLLKLSYDLDLRSKYDPYAAQQKADALISQLSKPNGQ